MKSTPRFFAALLFGLLMVLPRSAAEAGTKFNGQITGIEVCTQDLCGQAIFVYVFQGTVNGRPRKALGYVGVNHGSPLPGEGGSVPITQGSGVMFVGILPFGIDVDGGTITGIPDGDADDVAVQFGVQADLEITSLFGGSESHCANVLLDHTGLPFTILGLVTPGACP